MRKIIAAINMTLDGYCDHTAGIVTDETMQHYNELLRNSGMLVYGRTTYQMMEAYWPNLVREPGDNAFLNEFATLIDDIPKLAFSHTLQAVTWKNARLATQSVQQELVALKQQAGKDIVIGSPSLIAEATELKLIDEYQLCIHPVILGKGLVLFQNLSKEVDLKLTGTKTFGAGPVLLYYDTRLNKADGNG